MLFFPYLALYLLCGILSVAWLLPGRWLTPRVQGLAWLAPVACMAVVAWGLRSLFA